MCAASAAGQPDLQPWEGPTKRCLRCGDERTLFYFPVRPSRPDGWVICYACQYDLRLEAKQHAVQLIGALQLAAACMHACRNSSLPRL